MKYSEMIEILQNKEKESIVIINSGAFYIARGRDAIIMNKEFGMKLTCFEKDKICKTGFPINSLEKNIKILKEKGYSYIVYNYNREKNEIKIIEKNKGKIIIKEKENKRDCELCKIKYEGYTTKKSKYVEAIENFYGNKK